jgi:hypothetical protein
MAARSMIHRGRPNGETAVLIARNSPASIKRRTVSTVHRSK